MKRALALVLLLTGTVRADDPLRDPVVPPPTHWELSAGGNVPDDGRHIGLTWTRDLHPEGTVVVFRRVAPPGTSRTEGRHIHVVDERAGIIPMFMYPDTFRTQYYPAFDASQHAIPRGTKLGVWTVVGAVDGDPALWVDEVDPGQLYVYALVPAERGSAPDTYVSLEGDAIETPALAPYVTSLWRQRWFQAVLGLAGIGVIAGAMVLVKRRRRAGARPSAEASSTP